MQDYVMDSDVTSQDLDEERRWNQWNFRWLLDRVIEVPSRRNANEAQTRIVKRAGVCALRQFLP
jgi:hypothetical protein